jgi:hypothetical protein
MVSAAISGPQGEAEGGGDRRLHQAGIEQRCQFDQPTLALEASQQVAGDFERQRCLADAA